MRYQQLCLSVLFVCLAFALTSCQTNNIDMPHWDFGKKTVKPAEKAPEQITSASSPYNKGYIFEPQLATQENQTARINDNVKQEILAQPIRQNQTTQTYNSVRVAILLPLSGPQANLGKSLLQSAQMALFDVGQPFFELIPYDTVGTGDGARTAASNAINDGAQLILGPIFANSVRAAKSVVRYHNVNMIAFSTDWSVTSSNVFIMGFLPFDQIERIMTYAADQGYKRIAAIAPQTTYGRAIISAYQTLAQQLGIETIDVLSYDPNNPNLGPDLHNFTRYEERMAEATELAETIQSQKDTKSTPKQSKIKAEIARIKSEMEPPFDAVLIAAGGEHAVTISNLLSHYDLPPRKVKRLGIGLFDDMALSSEFALRDAWFSAPSAQGREKFNTRYKDLFSTSPPRLASLAYDATALSSILAQSGINYNGIPNFNRSAITNPNGFAGVDGIFRFLDNGTVERGLSILSFQNNNIVEIDGSASTFQQR